jgi:SNF2 family DNA or RNA helicase
MGLGKTVQAIAVLQHRMDAGPALVVAPVSVVPNWVSEVNRFAPALRVKTLHDSDDRTVTLTSLEAGDLLVTSYGLLLSEEDALTAKHWATVILDEAHVIKNYHTKTSKAAMTLQADFRIILTGTPLQNHLGEMWNLFQFINPGLLGDLSRFTEMFVRPADEHTRERLKKLISPFILRRTKTAVLKELPPKTEIVRKITLSDEETAFYEMLRRKAIESLESDDSPQGAKHIKILAEITRLRQACCHPALVSPGTGIESTKLSVFLEIASELKESGHRALVFSQFVTHLSLVRKALDEAGFSYQYLDGSTPTMKRLVEVRNFQNGVGDFFLISLKAGGLGLNLTSADYVIHLDPWWNPAIEDQASDRAYRIGQVQPVTVYRLVAKHTIEEKIIQLHHTKRDLADSLLEGSDRAAKLSINELMELIKERGEV